MGRSSYRKFMKQERAKVKLKNKDKKLLPKGQNVTDLNFKVKKIVIKTQLKDHQADEVLSSRKLNIQEVLSRLKHYSGSVCTEAVGQLESLLKSGGRCFLSTHLCPIVCNLANLLTSSHFHLRKAAIKLLSQILSQVEEREWLVLKGRLVSHIICGLSHIESGIRSDSLLALEAIPSTHILPAESLLPSLLDLVSTSKASGSRSLSTALSSSSTALRASVLRRIAAVLSTLHSTSPDEAELKKDYESFSNEDSVWVELAPFYSLDDEALSLSEFNTSLHLSTPKPLDLKEFTSTLVPLMLDSFAEVAPLPDDSEPVTNLKDDALALVATISETLLLLYDQLSSLDLSKANWMRDKFGKEVFNRLVRRRFPYSGGTSSGKKVSVKPSLLRVNLTLALLTQTLVPHNSDSSSKITHYLADVMRCQSSLREEEGRLYQRCLHASLSRPSKHTHQLLTSLTHLKRDRCGVYKEIFLVLRKVVMSGTNPKEMREWLDNLLTELSLVDTDLFRDSLDLLIEAAPLVDLPASFDTHFPLILGKAMNRNDADELRSVTSLAYWLSSCDNILLDTLKKLLLLQPHLTPHLTALLSHKCKRFPEGQLSQQLLQDVYWKQVISL